MLTVIVETADAGARLPALLAALTSAAVEGLVREVLIAGGGPPDLLDVLREETGAELTDTLADGIKAARSERLMVLPARIRFRSDWLEVLARHLRGGGGDAVIVGEGGFFGEKPFGVLIGRTAAAGLAHPDLKRLRGQLGRGAVRLA
jgi:nucleotide-binding universal stress UspA family protein